MEIPGRLKLVTVQLDRVLPQLRSSLPANTPFLGKWFDILTARVVDVNNTLPLALENYDGVVTSKHIERGLVNGICQYHHYHRS